jgi:urease accessory protein UreE
VGSRVLQHSVLQQRQGLWSEGTAHAQALCYNNGNRHWPCMQGKVTVHWQRQLHLQRPSR